MLKRILAGAVVGMGLGLSGCDSASMIGAADPSVPYTAASSPKIQGGDKLRVTVFGEDKLTGEYEVDPGGDVSLPLAGTVHASGLTKPELEQLLAKKFRNEYLKNPKVTVDVASFRPFYVLGEVQKPGEYPYKGNLNVLSAIAIAGGQTYRANNDKIMIQRAGEKEIRSYPLSISVPIYPGDLVRVPERYF
ncbi:polysaccharide export outer membrane protein [Rhodoblastus sphagnicola]|uniref:polysaccharide biosynthesis/export family protein n=1 Tax=Rhodoblastus sphagnicola TaxID=333368 RepID=UPI0016138829|nr:polysaccharide biosynthesis/export family protein [Rhodoblastus sphagnicola]MBB4200569.1 polysaccharide export outer membrane protein [Rhodoblastus sphagnicola]